MGVTIKGGWLALVLGLALLTGCATVRNPDGRPLTAAQRADPFEPTNRKVLKFNQGFNRVATKPFLTAYRFVLPGFVRRGIGNVLNLAGQPFVFVNELLQGKPNRAAQTLGRTMMNATVGICGLLDPAAKAGLPAHNEDFGQTLAVWGVGNGPYLVLPLLGPSTVRDGVGIGVEAFGDPLSVTLSQVGQKTANLALTASHAVDVLDRNYDNLEALEKSSVDFYAALKSAYLQSRASQIRDGVADPNAPDFDPLDDPEDASPQVTPQP